RSIYTRIMRNSRDPLLDVFDAPLWFSSAASRDTTTTPVQSLLLINSPLLLARSRAFAERLVRDEPDEAKRIALADRLALGRAPLPEELSSALAFLQDQAKRIDPKKARSAAATFAAGKIPYRDGQAALLAPDAGPGLSVGPTERFPTGDFTI